MGDFFSTGIIVAEFKQEGDDCLGQEDSGKDGGELIGARCEHLSRYSVWTSSFPGVHCQEHPYDIVLLYNVVQWCRVSGVVWDPGGGGGRDGADDCC